MDFSEFKKQNNADSWVVGKPSDSEQITKAFEKNDKSDTDKIAEIERVTYHYIGEKFLSYEIILISDVPLPQEFRLFCQVTVHKLGLFGKAVSEFKDYHRVYVPDSEFGFDHPITEKTRECRLRTTAVLDLVPADGIHGIKLGKYKTTVDLSQGILKTSYNGEHPFEITLNKTTW